MYIYIYTYKDICFIATHMAVRIADREQRNKINFYTKAFAFPLQSLIFLLQKTDL